MSRNFTVKEAVERYLRERTTELSESTLRNHRSLLEYFITYCKEEEGTENINGIDPFLVSDFRIHRHELVSQETVYNNLSTLRTFISWCEGRGLIEDNIADNMILPDITGGSRNTTISPERADTILTYLERYEYGTLRHALFALLWDTGMRRGAARSLNVSNFDKEERYVELEHKPEEETPLKNGKESEREVALSTETAQIIADYIKARRKQSTDDYGNEPLFSTQHGRAHRNTLAKNIAQITRPCFYSNHCPHDREIEECEANQYDGATKCPSSISPHPIRRSSITHYLDQGDSVQLLAKRMDVSVEVLKKHYDARTEKQKRELRRENLSID